MRQREKEQRAVGQHALQNGVQTSNWCLLQEWPVCIRQLINVQLRSRSILGCLRNIVVPPRRDILTLPVLQYQCRVIAT